MTSNNTIEGTEYKALPDVGDVPLVSDTSSDMFSRPIDVATPRADLRGRAEEHGPGRRDARHHPRRSAGAARQKTLPTMLNYAVHAENRSLYNTPPAFAVYTLGLVMKWLIATGRARRRSRRSNERKAAKLYAEIDRTGFYRGTAHKDGRSLMNVTFRLATEELEKQFVKESTAAGLDGLKGHRRSAACARRSTTRSPRTGVDALVAFMREFERKRG